MLTISLEGFIKFVNDQPDDRSINHDTYATCAVGDYLEVSDYHKEYAGVFAREFLGPLNKRSGIPTLGSLTQYTCPTYGDLKLLINQKTSNS